MASGYIKSPLNYMGGKYKTLSSIIPVIEQRTINSFYDVFAGGFNVGVNVDCSNVVCNDQITFLVDLFKTLAHTPLEEIKERINSRISEFSLSKTNADGYNALRERYNKSGDPLDLFVLTCFSFNHQIRFNSMHKFNTPFGKGRSAYNPNIENNLGRFVGALHEKTVHFLSLDFRELDYTVLTADDMAYFDPPYLISTGVYNDGKRGFKDWGEEEELALLEILDYLNTRGVPFALSNVMHNKGLSNNILIEWAGQYNVHFINNSFTNCSYHYKDRSTNTVEVLVTNFG